MDKQEKSRLPLFARKSPQGSANRTKQDTKNSVTTQKGLPRSSVKLSGLQKNGSTPKKGTVLPTYQDTTAPQVLNKQKLQAPKGQNGAARSTASVKSSVPSAVKAAQEKLAGQPAGSKKLFSGIPNLFSKLRHPGGASKGSIKEPEVSKQAPKYSSRVKDKQHANLEIKSSAKVGEPAQDSELIYAVSKQLFSSPGTVENAKFKYGDGHKQDKVHSNKNVPVYNNPETGLYAVSPVYGLEKDPPDKRSRSGVPSLLQKPQTRITPPRFSSAKMQFQGSNSFQTRTNKQNVLKNTTETSGYSVPESPVTEPDGIYSDIGPVKNESPKHYAASQVKISSESAENITKQVQASNKSNSSCSKLGFAYASPSCGVRMAELRASKRFGIKSTSSSSGSLGTSSVSRGASPDTTCSDKDSISAMSLPDSSPVKVRDRELEGRTKSPSASLRSASPAHSLNKFPVNFAQYSPRVSQCSTEGDSFSRTSVDETDTNDQVKTNAGSQEVIRDHARSSAEIGCDSVVVRKQEHQAIRDMTAAEMAACRESRMLSNSSNNDSVLGSHPSGIAASISNTEDPNSVQQLSALQPLGASTSDHNKIAYPGHAPTWDDHKPSRDCANNSSNLPNIEEATLNMKYEDPLEDSRYVEELLKQQSEPNSDYYLTSSCCKETDRTCGLNVKLPQDMLNFDTNSSAADVYVFDCVNSNSSKTQSSHLAPAQLCTLGSGVTNQALGWDNKCKPIPNETKVQSTSSVQHGDRNVHSPSTAQGNISTVSMAAIPRKSRNLSYKAATQGLVMGEKNEGLVIKEHSVSTTQGRTRSNVSPTAETSVKSKSKGRPKASQLKYPVKSNQFKYSSSYASGVNASDTFVTNQSKCVNKRLDSQPDQSGHASIRDPPEPAAQLYQSIKPRETSHHIWTDSENTISSAECSLCDDKDCEKLNLATTITVCPNSVNSHMPGKLTEQFPISPGSEKITGSFMFSSRNFNKVESSKSQTSPDKRDQCTQTNKKSIVRQAFIKKTSGVAKNDDTTGVSTSQQGPFRSANVDNSWSPGSYNTQMPVPGPLQAGSLENTDRSASVSDNIQSCQSSGACPDSTNLLKAGSSFEKQEIQSDILSPQGACEKGHQALTQVETLSEIKYDTYTDTQQDTSLQTTCPGTTHKRNGELPLSTSLNTNSPEKEPGSPNSDVTVQCTGERPQIRPSSASRNKFGLKSGIAKFSARKAQGVSVKGQKSDKFSPTGAENLLSGNRKELSGHDLCTAQGAGNGDNSLRTQDPSTAVEDRSLLLGDSSKQTEYSGCNTVITTEAEKEVLSRNTVNANKTGDGGDWTSIDSAPPAIDKFDSPSSTANFSRKQFGAISDKTSDYPRITSDDRDQHVSTSLCDQTYRKSPQSDKNDDQKSVRSAPVSNTGKYVPSRDSVSPDLIENSVIISKSTVSSDKYKSESRGRDTKSPGKGFKSKELGNKTTGFGFASQTSRNRGYFGLPRPVQSSKGVQNLSSVSAVNLTHQYAYQYENSDSSEDENVAYRNSSASLQGFTQNKSGQNSTKNGGIRPMHLTETDNARISKTKQEQETKGKPRHQVRKSGLRKPASSYNKSNDKSMDQMQSSDKIRPTSGLRKPGSKSKPDSGRSAGNGAKSSSEHVQYQAGRVRSAGNRTEKDHAGDSNWTQKLGIATRINKPEETNLSSRMSETRTAGASTPKIGIVKPRKAQPLTKPHLKSQSEQIKQSPIGKFGLRDKSGTSSFYDARPASARCLTKLSDGIKNYDPKYNETEVCSKQSVAPSDEKLRNLVKRNIPKMSKPTVNRTSRVPVHETDESLPSSSDDTVTLSDGGLGSEEDELLENNKNLSVSYHAQQALINTNDSNSVQGYIHTKVKPGLTDTITGFNRNCDHTIIEEEEEEDVIVASANKVDMHFSSAAPTDKSSHNVAHLYGHNSDSSLSPIHSNFSDSGVSSSHFDSLRSTSSIQSQCTLRATSPKELYNQSSENLICDRPTMSSKPPDDHLMTYTTSSKMTNSDKVPELGSVSKHEFTEADTITEVKQTESVMDGVEESKGVDSLHERDNFSSVNIDSEPCVHKGSQPRIESTGESIAVHTENVNLGNNSALTCGAYTNFDKPDNSCWDFTSPSNGVRSLSPVTIPALQDSDNRSARVVIEQDLDNSAQESDRNSVLKHQQQVAVDTIDKNDFNDKKSLNRESSNVQLSSSVYEAKRPSSAGVSAVRSKHVEGGNSEERSHSSPELDQNEHGSNRKEAAHNKGLKRATATTALHLLHNGNSTEMLLESLLVNSPQSSPVKLDAPQINNATNHQSDEAGCHVNTAQESINHTLQRGQDPANSQEVIAQEHLDTPRAAVHAAVGSSACLEHQALQEQDLTATELLPPAEDLRVTATAPKQVVVGHVPSGASFDLSSNLSCHSAATAGDSLTTSADGMTTAEAAHKVSDIRDAECDSKTNLTDRLSTVDGGHSTETHAGAVSLAGIEIQADKQQTPSDNENNTDFIPEPTSYKQSGDNYQSTLAINGHTNPETREYDTSVGDAKRVSSADNHDNAINNTPHPEQNEYDTNHIRPATPVTGATNEFKEISADICDKPTDVKKSEMLNNVDTDISVITQPELACPVQNTADKMENPDTFWPKTAHTENAENSHHSGNILHSDSRNVTDKSRSELKAGVIDKDKTEINMKVIAKDNLELNINIVNAERAEQNLISSPPCSLEEHIDASRTKDTAVNSKVIPDLLVMSSESPVINLQEVQHNDLPRDIPDLTLEVMKDYLGADGRSSGNLTLNDLLDEAQVGSLCSAEIKGVVDSPDNNDGLRTAFDGTDGLTGGHFPEDCPENVYVEHCYSSDEDIYTMEEMERGNQFQLGGIPAIIESEDALDDSFTNDIEELGDPCKTANHCIPGIIIIDDTEDVVDTNTNEKNERTEMSSAGYIEPETCLVRKFEAETSPSGSGNEQNNNSQVLNKYVNEVLDYHWTSDSLGPETSTSCETISSSGHSPCPEKSTEKDTNVSCDYDPSEAGFSDKNLTTSGLSEVESQSTMVSSCDTAVDFGDLHMEQDRNSVDFSRESSVTVTHSSSVHRLQNAQISEHSTNTTKEPQENIATSTRRTSHGASAVERLFGCKKLPNSAINPARCPTQPKIRRTWSFPENRLQDQLRKLSIFSEDFDEATPLPPVFCAAVTSSVDVRMHSVIPKDTWATTRGQGQWRSFSVDEGLMHFSIAHGEADWRVPSENW